MLVCASVDLFDYVGLRVGCWFVFCFQTETNITKQVNQKADKYPTSVFHRV